MIFMIIVGSTRTPMFATTWYALAMSMSRISPAPIANERPKRERSQSRLMPSCCTTSTIASTTDGARDLERRQVQRFAQRLADGRGSVLLLRRVLRLVDVPAAVRRGQPMSYRRVAAVMPAFSMPARYGEELEGRAGLPQRDAGVVVVALHLGGVRVVVVRADVREHLSRSSDPS
jgi:hypothetical protein